MNKPYVQYWVIYSYIQNRVCGCDPWWGDNFKIMKLYSLVNTLNIKVHFFWLKSKSYYLNILLLLLFQTVSHSFHIIFSKSIFTNGIWKPFCTQNEEKCSLPSYFIFWQAEMVLFIVQQYKCVLFMYIILIWENNICLYEYFYTNPSTFFIIIFIWMISL